MNRLVIGCVLAVGCAEDPLTVGDISAIEAGNGKVEISACIEVAGESCAKSPMDVTLTYADTQMTLPYGGFLFGSYGATLDLVDRDADFVLVHGYDEARMHLPPAFELSADRTSLRRDQTLTLSWERGTSPMAWELTYACDGGGWVRGENVDDGAGKLEIDGDEIFDRIDHRDPTICQVSIQLSRIETGTIERGFGADRATGVTQRYVRVELFR